MDETRGVYAARRRWMGDFLAANSWPIEECVNWPFATTKTVRAPQWALEAATSAFHGSSPFSGKYKLHSCDNPLCVNPNHLRWGTAAENMQERSARGRAPSKLSPEQVVLIQRAHDAGYAQLEIALEFGVSRQTVHRIVNNKSWQQLIELAKETA